ncbi:type I glyceraldehyde-3-phosphate dehydrogenase [Paenibacillus chondroitinus]|uniref:Glyceraldehyde-3-phosphate dehydrogenase n=1 Tax=Paenibacillus chondroitinus TaxID=59842 RepID=A0ABU6D9R1_9BACL|nr:type I glyceraldehyde-3-phosphate dehydrogenase [Paenibacillus anseongense]MCY9656836.1 type I glyceraldehyde-3-phosphate dehydrogenase [Paenibacillus anseongense]MEB4794486.1 type I glyceraldehyde-3-phosphate dehydrogenase [Paenibacillus chondroitinus]
MEMRVGLSGTGRIGRLVLRKALTGSQQDFQIAVVNSTCPIHVLAHLLKYDSVHGTWDARIEVTPDNVLIINGQSIRVVCEREPDLLPWKELGVEMVIDATGKFNHRHGAERHLFAGAKKVLITAPGTSMDVTLVMGVNEGTYNPLRHHLISAASCTTNCIAPILHILDQAFQIKTGWMTTVHAFTNDQNHLDNPHKDLRRARSCTNAIIPTSTGVGKALADVLPHLAEQIQGVSVRVPTQDVSLLDLQVAVGRNVHIEEVKSAMKQAVAGPMADFVDYNELPLVSADYIGNAKSAIIDGLTMMTKDNQIKLLAWYDNEWGYASRVIDEVAYISRAESTLEKEGTSCLIQSV